MRTVAAFISCALCVLAQGAITLASPQATPPREIIAKIYNPVVRSRMSAIRSFIVSGTVTVGNRHGVTMTYWKAPDKYVNVIKYADESDSYVAGFDGRKGWYEYPSGVIEVLGANEAFNDCTGLWLSNSDWFPERWPTTIHYVGWTMVQGAPAILVDVTMKMCGKSRDTYDAKTFRRIYANRLSNGRVVLDRNAPVLRGSHGFVFPAFSELLSRGTSIRGSIWYDSVRVNIPLDGDLFALPRCWGQCPHGR